MARRKRNSEALEKAERRIESLLSLTPPLNFGSDVNIETYATLIAELRIRLAAYNTALSNVDKLAGDVDDAEKAVMQLTEKLLLAVGARYGKDSLQYEMAGGSRRKSARRRATTAST